MGAGRRPALAFALGVLVGSASWGVAAALGLSAIMLANAWLFELIRYAGAAYLAWLAVLALRRALKPETSGTFKAQSDSGDLSLFLKGAAIHLTNPKAILSWGAIYAIVAPAGASLVTLLTYFALLYAGSILIFIGYAFLFSSQAMVAIYLRSRRWFDFAFAGFFGFASFKVLTARLQ